MSQLLDIFGFLAVLLRGASLALQSLVIGGVVFGLLILSQIRVSFSADYKAIDEAIQKMVAYFAAALLVVQLCYISANSTLLMGTAEISLGEVVGANFFLAGLASILSAITILIFVRGRSTPFSWPLIIPVLVILGSSVATSHSMARVEDRWQLVLLTAIHQGATAAWVGGLPFLLVGLKRCSNMGAVPVISKRFSRIAQWSVAALFLAGLGLSVVYIGSTDAIYGTAYGLMVAAKVILFCLLLILGALNYFIVRRMSDGAPALSARLRRFAEAEIGIGFSVILAAASLTSQPPSIDLPHDRVTASAIAERMTPRAPRLETPPLSSLSPPTPLVWDSGAPTSFVPGVTYRPPSEGDIAWSEYNHHWAGLIVLSAGLLALLARTGFGFLKWARHWPLVFIALAAFLLLRADPENWPLGPKGFWESFAVADVAQHRIFVVLITAFAVFEWGVRMGYLRSSRAAMVFPLVCAAGGAILLTHTHSLANIQEELLVEMTHIPLALLGIVAGWSRWLELRLPDKGKQRLLSWIWPVCFVLLGLLLLFYRES